VDEKTLSFYYLCIQHIKNCTARLVQMGTSTGTQMQGQAALTAVTDVIKECLLVHDRLLFLHSR